MARKYMAVMLEEGFVKELRKFGEPKSKNEERKSPYRLLFSAWQYYKDVILKR